ncbi:MAG: hypothetical protein R2838_07330 [Caldilineaceae bacterium]
MEALAFERRFIYTDAPWDRYLAGDETALNDAPKCRAHCLLRCGGPERSTA